MAFIILLLILLALAVAARLWGYDSRDMTCNGWLAQPRNIDYPNHHD